MHDRRRFLSLAAGVPFAAYLPRRSPGVSAMEGLGEQAARILAEYYQHDLTVTRDGTALHLRYLAGLVDGAMTDRARHARIRATGRYRAVRGQALCDIGELDQAQRTLSRAHLDAVQVDDRDLVAYVRSLQAKAADHGCHYRKAVELLRDGLKYASPQLRPRLAAQQLGPLASMGRTGEFAEMLMFAHGLADDAGLPDTAAPAFDTTDRATVTRFALEGYARWGVGARREEARDDRNLEAVRAVDNANLSGPACTMRLDLAAALMVEEPEHACDLMRETVDIVARFGAPAPTLVDRAGRVLRGGDPRIPAVRDITDVLRTTWQVAA